MTIESCIDLYLNVVKHYIMIFSVTLNQYSFYKLQINLRFRLWLQDAAAFTNIKKVQRYAFNLKSCCIKHKFCKTFLHGKISYKQSSIMTYLFQMNINDLRSVLILLIKQKVNKRKTMILHTFADLDIRVSKKYHT